VTIRNYGGLIQMDYEDTKRFWNAIFEKEPVNTELIEHPIPYEEIENGLKHLEGLVLDFGCGNGTLLLRTLFQNAEYGIGIDISEASVEKAKARASALSLEDKTEFFAGSDNVLTHFRDRLFDSVILSNILDNMLPGDGMALIRNVTRLIRPGGKVFLKLNDFMDSEQMIQSGAELIDENLYREREGIYLWNLSDEAIADLFDEAFETVESKRIELKGTVNRLFIFKKKA